MRKVGVIGLGHVGSTVAYTLVTKGIADELVLIDTNEAKCTAEFYDLLDSLGRLDTGFFQSSSDLLSLLAVKRVFQKTISAVSQRFDISESSNDDIGILQSLVVIH